MFTHAAFRLFDTTYPAYRVFTRRSPLAHRPWVRVMLVFAQVSSMNTSRLGSIVA